MIMNELELARSLTHMLDLRLCVTTVVLFVQHRQHHFLLSCTNCFVVRHWYIIALVMLKR